ncbi:MAG: response regulator [Desulfobacteraceae bacterium]|nr:response regulator [Desulfobacteraceae bacterium]
MMKNDHIHFKIKQIAASLEANIQSCHDTLNELKRLSMLLFSEIRADRSDIERWFETEGFGVDDAGFWLRLPLQKAFRSNRAPGTAVSYSWHPGQRNDPETCFRMYCLRNIGIHLEEIRTRLPGSAWFYYQDVTNTSVQFPYVDQREAIEPGFDWSSYHTFVSVAPANNPERMIRWTKPTIDYAGEGLIISASVPIYLADEFVGLWSIDLPMKSLYQNYLLERSIPDQANFIVDCDGTIVAHPAVEIEIDKAKGSIFQRHLHSLGPEFKTISLSRLKKQGKGRFNLIKEDCSDLMVYYEVMPGIEWIFFATFPGASMQDTAYRSIRAALDRVKSGDLSYRFTKESDIEHVRLIAEACNEMLAILENQEEIRKKAQQDLLKSEEMFRNLFEHSHDAIFIHTLDGSIRKVNRSGSVLLGYPHHELSAMNLLDLLPGKGAADVKTALERCRNQGSMLLETKLITRFAALLTVEISFSIISPKQGLFQAICRDLSDRLRTLEEKKKLEKRLNHYQKMEAIGTLAGGIAHDFNNILFPIMGYSEMLFEDLPEESPEYRKVKKIYKAANRAKELTMQILTFSRQAEQEQSPVQYQLIVKEALKLLRASIPKDIEIIQNIKPGGSPVFADPAKLHQIIMNLCTNAFHAVQESGGRFEVRMDEVDICSDAILGNPGLEPGAYIHLSVSDTGHGIDQEILPMIFDPYFTTKENGKGTGLGLSVTYGIVKDLNGDIKVYSEPGKGTTFHVYLPRAETVTLAENFPGEPIANGTEHILLVDDEVCIAQMGRQMLEKHGYRVTTYTDSLEALEAFRANSDGFDLVVTDMTMPNMTGDILAAEIKHLSASTPVILCTGFSEKISQKNYSTDIIDDFLMKPVTMHTFSRSIRNLLD